MAFFEEVLIKSGIIGLYGGFNDGMFGLKSLNKNMGIFGMTAADTPKNLSEKMKTTFFGSKIREGESGVSLNHANCSKMG